jgi:hypothetical protein
MCRKPDPCCDPCRTINPAVREESLLDQEWQKDKIIFEKLDTIYFKIKLLGLLKY